MRRKGGKLSPLSIPSADIQQPFVPVEETVIIKLTGLGGRPWMMQALAVLGLTQKVPEDLKKQQL